MRGLTSGPLLDVWEAGADANNPARARLLLESAGAWAEGFGLGERDARLLELRRRTFGEELRAIVRCPQCGQQLEVASCVSDISFEEIAPELRGGRPFATTVDGVEIAGRTPTVADLTAAARCPDVDSARLELVWHCVTSGLSGPPEDLSPEVVRAIGDAAAEADPQAEIRFRLSCACCGHEWAAVLDITDFLWREVAAAGERLLDEVGVLAAAYGWPEQEILALSPWRRRTYLDRVSDG